MDTPSARLLSTPRRPLRSPLLPWLTVMPSVAWGCGDTTSHQTTPPRPESSPLPLRDSATLRASIRFPEPPRAQRYLSAEIDIVSGDGSPVLDVSLDKVEPWMTVHGHGSATGRLTYQPAAQKPGSFAIEGLYFIMAGSWDLRLKISTAATNGGRQEASSTLSVEVLP